MEDIRISFDAEAGTWNVYVLVGGAWECVSTNCHEHEAQTVEEILANWRAESA